MRKSLSVLIFILFYIVVAETFSSEIFSGTLLDEDWESYNLNETPLSPWYVENGEVDFATITTFENNHILSLTDQRADGPAARLIYPSDRNIIGGSVVVEMDIFLSAFGHFEFAIFSSDDLMASYFSMSTKKTITYSGDYPVICEENNENAWRHVVLSVDFDSKRFSVFVDGVSGECENVGMEWILVQDEKYEINDLDRFVYGNLLNEKTDGLDNLTIQCTDCLFSDSDVGRDDDDDDQDGCGC